MPRIGLGEKASAQAAMTAKSEVLLWPLGLSCQARRIGLPSMGKPASFCQAASRASKSRSCQGSGRKGTASPSASISKDWRNSAGVGGRLVDSVPVSSWSCARSWSRSFSSLRYPIFQNLFLQEFHFAGKLMQRVRVEAHQLVDVL